jgi:uncharacterized membrane protein YdjX (TVP38/TMEM64 family)
MVDKVISKEGLKVVFLLRLSPLLPFALSNYLYGVTSVDFGSYIVGTFFGFAPGTLGVVYAGSVGKALTTDGVLALPWYGYLGAGAAIVALGQWVAKYAASVIEEMEREDAQGGGREAGTRLGDEGSPPDGTNS